MKNSEKTITISKKDFDLLTSVYPKISSLKQHLENAVHPKYIQEIDVISNTIKSVLDPFWKIEEKDWDKNYNQLSKISDKNKFKTVWSISEVRANELDDEFPFSVKKLYYKDQSITFDDSKKISWLDMWKSADKIIRMSGDDHHIFIEHFEQDKKNKECYNLVTGS